MKDQQAVFLVVLSLLLSHLVAAQTPPQPLWKSFQVRVDGGYEQNFWSPYEAYELKYDVRGFKIFYFDAQIDHPLEKWYVPKVIFHWETNFNSPEQNELIKVHSAQTQLEQSYQKISTAIGLFNTVKLVEGAVAGKFDVEKRYDKFRIGYLKETFFLKVEPAVSGLRYAAYYSDNVYEFKQGLSYSQFTKFQELNATFDTGGTLLLFNIVQKLLKMEDKEINLGTEGESRLGLFYAVYRKPYSISQVLGGSGSTSGETNTIYNARFNIYGFREEAKIGEYYSFVNRFGFATINLNKDTELQDLELPQAHFFLGFDHAVSIPIRFSEGFSMKLFGSVSYNVIVGGEINQETQELETKSHLDNDLFYKIGATFSFRF